jgi:type II secretory pathway component GspD/PulD (secretin)
LVCLNNQVSALRIVNQNGYLASVQNTSFGGGSATGSSTGNSVTSQITPGTLVTGLTLYILPKIMNNKIYLQVNADLSNSLGFSNISSGGATPTTIQVPNVTQKQFNQRSVIGSGDTLIMAGFRQVQNTQGAMQFLDSQALGGNAAQQTNTETIILITPIILNGYV